ncbi:hypothetical protein RIF29_05456 [Crotalaria pallida]|uniref:Uncharacterized protein n=1 Tax=Crotalaria pallida TaxID=3830 RepID=A0AAN9PAM8_CROPI
MKKHKQLFCCRVRDEIVLCNIISNNKIFKCYFHSFNKIKVKKSWYLSSTCHWLGFTGLYSIGFFFLGLVGLR